MHASVMLESSGSFLHQDVGRRTSLDVNLLERESKSSRSKVLSHRVRKYRSGNAD